MQISAKRWFVIINPAAGRGKAPEIWKSIKSAFDNNAIEYQAVFSERPNHAAELCFKIKNAGGKKYLIIGGDGTANEVINGIFNAPINPLDSIIAMVAAGTGNDWVRTIGKHKSINSFVNSIKRENTFSHDIGLIKYHKNGKMQQRYFLNIAGFGYDGMVAKKLSEDNTLFKGAKLQYMAAILKTLLFYNHTKIILSADGITSEHQILSIACGICKYNGGGGLMQLPHAEFNDGILDMTLIRKMSKIRMIQNLPRLTNGSFLTMREVKTFSAKEFIIESKKPVYVEADGEFLGETPAKISIITSAINVLEWQNHETAY